MRVLLTLAGLAVAMPAAAQCPNGQCQAPPVFQSSPPVVPAPVVVGYAVRPAPAVVAAPAVTYAAPVVVYQVRRVGPVRGFIRRVFGR